LGKGRFWLVGAANAPDRPKIEVFCFQALKFLHPVEMAECVCVNTQNYMEGEPFYLPTEWGIQDLSVGRGYWGGSGARR
jgi:hypothetical protein